MSAAESREGKDAQGDLLSTIRAEDWLLNRLTEQGIDVYAGAGPYKNLRDRLAQAIVVNRYGPVVAGRHNGKPETYEQFVLRVFDIKLKDVPRETKVTKEASR